jgi:small-conductance mechanosensitive channel
VSLTRTFVAIDFTLGASLLGASAWIAANGNWSTALSAAAIAALCLSVGMSTWRRRDEFPPERRQSRAWQRMVQWQVVALLFGGMAFLPLMFGDSLLKHAVWAGWCVVMMMLTGKRRTRRSRGRQVAEASPS